MRTALDWLMVLAVITVVLVAAFEIWEHPEYIGISR